MKASGAWRVLECSQRSSLPSGLDHCLEFSKQPLALKFQDMQTQKRISYCLKVKVFLQLSDAGDISELIMEMAFPLK